MLGCWGRARPQPSSFGKCSWCGAVSTTRPEPSPAHPEQHLPPTALSPALDFCGGQELQLVMRLDKQGGREPFPAGLFGYLFTSQLLSGRE